VASSRRSAIGDRLAHIAGEEEIDAESNALLPGLNDHHFHLLAFAASLESVPCGPPAVSNADELAAVLRARQSSAPGDWIRGIGYHQTVAGDIDRHWLDGIAPATPVRIQHRGGRLWVFNSRALDRITPGSAPSPLETVDSNLTGRLYDGDAWLRERLGTQPPPLAKASRLLLSRGVTGLTDSTPNNGAAEFAILRAAIERGELLQDIQIMGGAGLETVQSRPGLRIAHRKIHLREAALPDISEIAAEITRCHGIGRPVAVHCVTLAELMFTLGAFDETGSLPGDRIEHAGVTPPDALPLIAAHGLTVVTQPNFVAERGDAYLREVETVDQPWLYRLRGIRDARIRLAGSTDAPFGDADPWKAMAAAVTRRTAGGAILGEREALQPEDALGLFLGALDDPGAPPRQIRVGTSADLCLLDRPWAEARIDLADVVVARTFKAGKLV